jgi:hypothetical protein
MLVAVGSAFALANLVMTIMIMAQGGSGKLARAWVVGVLGGVLVWVLSAQEPGAHRTLMLVMHVIFQHISISRCGWLLMELEAS